MQIPFFSMNGYFNWDEARSSAKTHTTCALFVRACRAAARILERREWKTNTQSGTDPCITGPGLRAGVSYDTRGKREPRRGDIFHVGNKGRNNDHVGVILRHSVDALGSARNSVALRAVQRLRRPPKRVRWQTSSAGATVFEADLPSPMDGFSCCRAHR